VKKGGQVLASYAYDLAGHLLQAANPQARLAFSWDSLGNQLSESLELLHPAFAGLGVKQLRRSFDLANRVQEVELPDGLGRLQRGYDAGDRLVSLGVDGATLWQASYDGARLGRIERGNGLVTAFAYTAEGLPAHVLTGLGEGSGEVAHPLHRLAFSWTLGQLQRSRLREDMAKELWAFHYDSLGHLEDKAGDPAWPAVKRLEPAWQLAGLPVPASLVESWQVGVGKRRVAGSRKWQRANRCAAAGVRHGRRLTKKERPWEGLAHPGTEMGREVFSAPEAPGGRQRRSRLRKMGWLRSPSQLGEGQGLVGGGAPCAGVRRQPPRAPTRGHGGLCPGKPVLGRWDRGGGW
jgi:YD repeat-containing protein